MPEISVCLVPSSTEVNEGHEVDFNVYIFNSTDDDLYDVDVSLHFKETLSKHIKIIPKGQKEVVEFKAVAPMYLGMQSPHVSVSYVDPKSLSRYAPSSSIRVIVKKNKEHIEADEMFAKAQKEYSEAELIFTEARFQGRDVSQAEPLLESSRTFLGKAVSLLSMNSYKLALYNANLALEHATRVKKTLSGF